jgi:co-chaperonin GroES (HSP10)
MSNVLRPVGQKLLIAPIVAEETGENGVIIPVTNNADLAKGKIVQVSPYLIGIYEVGENVLYHEKRAIGWIHDNKPHYLIDGGDGLAQGDVLAIID